MEGSDQLSVAAPLTLAKEHSASVADCVGPKAVAGDCGEETNILPPSGIEPRFYGRLAHSLVTIPTEM